MVKAQSATPALKHLRRARPIIGLIGRRTLGSLAAIVGASIVVFILLRLVPGNPARAVLGQFASDQAVESLTNSMGLNEPIYVQYYRYVADFLRGDWGVSYSTGEAVMTQMTSRLPATLELALAAFALAFGAAVVLALLSTYRRRPWLDGSARGVAAFGLGTPPFWIGLVLLVVFSEYVPFFPGPEGRLSSGVEPPPKVTGLYTVDALIALNPSTFLDAVWHLVLPAVALGLAPFAFLMRLLRANLRDVAGEPFILVVRSKGVSRWKTFVRHALPNAFLPTLTAGGLVLGQLVAGSVLVEKVYNWPGVGTLVTNGILQQDYSVLQTFILLTAVVYIGLNLIVDVVSGMVDPRVRTGSVDTLG